jgi:hypothetical protein
MDPIYGYQALNVEAQEKNPDVAAALDPAHDRDQEAAPGLRRSAATTSSVSSNPSVLAFVRMNESGQNEPGRNADGPT